ncbi:MAG TPA: thiol:disulfide interchange protein DsbA/DsbL [Burkholderiales bacterium]|jgi:thiol:disulfide interchange protein DsbA|nr:thiol:disulfide interchange protein DsbA/DsbL [Burkholderiales bacterium]
MAARLRFSLPLVLWLACVSFAQPAAAQSQADLDYREIPQQPIETGDKIEVIDFFFYGCQYCNDLLPRLERWRRGMPADVVMRHIPVVRHDSWVPLAKTYFTLEAMGEVERLHPAVFHSYHVEDLYMSQEKVIAEWAGKQGLDREKFMAIYRSDETRQKVERARKQTMEYEIQGTPSLVVDGRFLTDGASAKTIEILDRMVRIARQQREKKAGK